MQATKFLILITLIIGLSTLSFSQKEQKFKNLYNKGVEAQETGNYSDAVDFYKKFYLKSNNNIKKLDACYNIGVCYMKLNECKSAYMYFTKVKKVGDHMHIDISKYTDLESLYLKAKKCTGQH